MFDKGTIYTRRELHKKYGGQMQGGISTPANHPFIMLFSSDSGGDYGYRDGWTDDGLFLYSGEGQAGDMVFERGNKAIRDHHETGKSLHLFNGVGRGQVEYVGEFSYVGHRERKLSDKDGVMRSGIVFELKPVD